MNYDALSDIIKKVSHIKYCHFSFFPGDGDNILFHFQFSYGNMSFCFTTLQHFPVLLTDMFHMLKIVTASLQVETERNRTILADFITFLTVINSWFLAECAKIAQRNVFCGCFLVLNIELTLLTYELLLQTFTTVTIQNFPCNLIFLFFPWAK